MTTENEITNILTLCKDVLQHHIVRIKFEKVSDGSIKKTIGTLLEQYLPERKQTSGLDSVYKKTNESQIIYFDLVDNDWRSCKKENLITFEII